MVSFLFKNINFAWSVKKIHTIQLRYYQSHVYKVSSYENETDQK